MNPFDLAGTQAIVTGAGSGIGQAIALALARAGADIVGVGRSAMDETEELVAAEGRAFALVRADLSDMAEVRGLIARAGQADILVNNAGIIRRADATDLSEEDWDLVMDTNLKAVFFLCQDFARAAFTHHRPGKIVNIASLL